MRDGKGYLPAIAFLPHSSHAAFREAFKKKKKKKKSKEKQNQKSFFPPWIKQKCFEAV